MYDAGIYVDPHGRTMLVLSASTRKKYNLKNKDKARVYEKDDRIIVCFKENTEMRKNFVNFLLPGAICTESSSIEIESSHWDVEKAIELWKNKQFKPYGFFFTTFERNDLDWMPKEIARSGTYFINGTVKTLDEIKAENNSRNEILIANMECNGWRKFIQTQSGFTHPFLDEDVNLEV